MQNTKKYHLMHRPLLQNAKTRANCTTTQVSNSRYIQLSPYVTICNASACGKCHDKHSYRRQQIHISKKLEMLSQNALLYTTQRRQTRNVKSQLN